MRLTSRSLLCLAALGWLSNAAAAQLPSVPVPAGNPITADKANLGKVLFWDEQLSSTRAIACGTCHVPATGGSDPRSGGPGSTHPGPDGVFGTGDDSIGSPGVVRSRADGTYLPTPWFGLDPQVTRRKSNSMINAAYQSRTMFWDGRANGVFRDPLTGEVLLRRDAALESQVVEPPIADVEMGHVDRDWPAVTAQLEQSQPLALATDIPPALEAWMGRDSYPALFDRAFGSPEVTPARVAMAIATYERTLISDQAPIDAYLAGQTTALTPAEQRGYDLFEGAARCFFCHFQPLFARLDPGPRRLFGLDPRFPEGTSINYELFFNIGVRPAAEDRGRAVVTGVPGHEGAFKMPILRNVGLRAPYFHDGSQATLEGVVDFYDRGGDYDENKNPLIVPLGLTDGEKSDLVAFLRNALTDPRVAAELPPFDRPTLYSETLRPPRSYGVGAAGSAGHWPRLIGMEPPYLGNPNMTLAIANALGGTPAVLLLGVAPAAAGGAYLGVPLHVDIGPALVAIPVAGLAGTGPGGGHFSLPLAMPTDPTLAQAKLYAQGLIADRGAPLGLAGTQGLEVTLFAPR